MMWLAENWFWIVVFALFLWVHLKMHGGHGHHGAHGGHGGHRGSAAGAGPGQSERRSPRQEDDHAGH